MKKNQILLLLSVLMVSFLLTGCIQANIHVTVNKDGSADLNYKVGIDKNLMDLGGGEVSDLFVETATEAQKEGYATSNYDDEKYVGIEMKKHITTLDELAKENSMKELVGSDKSELIKVNETFFYTEYILDTGIDLSDAFKDSGLSAEEISAAKMAMDQMDFQFKLTLPEKTDTNNATTVSVDGKTLEWKLTGQDNSIKATMKVLNMQTVTVTASGFLALLIGLIIFVKRSKK